MNPAGRKTLINFVMVFCGVFLSKFFVFVYRILIVRELSVGDYAVFALLMTFFNWILLFSHFDLYAPVSKYVSAAAAKSDLNSAFSYYANALSLALGLSLAAGSLAVVVQRGCGVGPLTLAVLFMAAVPFAFMHISDGFLKGLGNFRLSGILGGLDGLLRLGLMAGFVVIVGSISLEQALRLFGYAYWLVALAAGLMVVGLRRGSGRTGRPQFGRDRGVMRSLFAYAKWVTMADIVSTGIVLVNIYLISFTSSRDVAVFNVVWLIYNIFQMAFGVITAVLIPQIARSAAKGSRIGLPGSRQFAVLSGLALMLVLAIAYMPFKAELLRLVFKRAEYAQCLDYMAILLVGLPFQLFTMINRGICQGLDNPRAIAGVELLSFAVNLPVFWGLYRWQGLPGAFGALLLVFVVECLLTRQVTRATVRRHNAVLA